MDSAGPGISNADIRFVTTANGNWQFGEDSVRSRRNGINAGQAYGHCWSQRIILGGGIDGLLVGGSLKVRWLHSLGERPLVGWKEVSWVGWDPAAKAAKSTVKLSRWIDQVNSPGIAGLGQFRARAPATSEHRQLPVLHSSTQMELHLDPESS